MASSPSGRAWSTGGEEEKQRTCFEADVNSDFGQFTLTANQAGRWALSGSLVASNPGPVLLAGHRVREKAPEPAI